MKPFVVLFSLFISTNAFAAGETITDGSLGEKVNLGSNSFDVPQTLGKTVGNNLFHSFSQFNINTGQTATFTGANTLQNVITRVTGGEVSNIEGTLKSQVGNADFYFINPAGVTFGQNAVVDVPAAFHVSTANNLQFKDGKVFDYANSSASSLSSGTPESFGFVNGSIANNGLLAVIGSHLAVKPEQKLDLVARNIEIKSVENQDASLTANAGFIRLAAMKEGNVNVDGFSLPDEMPDDKNAGNITVNGQASKLVPPENFAFENFTDGNVHLDSTGNGGGSFALWGNQVDFKKVQAWSDNKGDINSTSEKLINWKVNEAVLNEANLTFNPLSKGNVGNIEITAKTLKLLNGAAIDSSAWGQGNAGNVNVNATDTLIIDNQTNEFFTGIKSNSEAGGSGNAGSVEVNAKELELLNGGAVSSSTSTEGDAGIIKVNVIDRLVVNGADAEGTTAKITSSSYQGGSGNAGNVEVNAKEVELLNGGQILSATWTKGDAGQVKVSASDKLIISGENSVIASGTQEGTGNAGDVEVNAKELEILNGGSIDSSTSTQGNAGQVKVNVADKLTIDAKASMFLTGVASSSFGKGNAGSAEVNATELIMLGGCCGTIDSSAWAQGSAGQVKVNVIDKISIGSGSISSGRSIADDGVGRAGNVEVKAKELELFGGGTISSDTWAEGDAGQVTVNANLLRIADGGTINTDTHSVGAAGHTIVTADYLNVDGYGYFENNMGLSPWSSSTISSNASSESTGKTGNVSVTANKELSISNQAQISATNDGIAPDISQIEKTKVVVTSPKITLSTGGNISTNSGGNVPASDIVVNASQLLDVNDGHISTTSKSADGGSITINTPNTLTSLKNSAIQTTVNSAEGNGGDININAGLLLMNSAAIQANAESGNGGNINLKIDALIPSGNMLIKGGKQQVWQSNQFGFNLIQAASALGVSGNVNSSAPQLNLSGILASFGKPAFEAIIVNQDFCNINSGSSLTKVGNGGLPKKASDLW